MVIELRGADTKLTEVVSEHGHVLDLRESSPLIQTPVVYEPRKNSSEVRRSSTPSQ